MADPVISPPEVALSAPVEHSRRQLEALLEVSEAIAQQRDLPALFHDLAERLHSVVDFDFLTLVLHDPVRNVMRLHILESRIDTHNKPTGSETPMEGDSSADDGTTTARSDGIWPRRAAADHRNGTAIHAARCEPGRGGCGQRAEF